MYFGAAIPAYGLAYFTPTIVGGHGYGLIQTQLHSVPLQAAALVFAIVLASASDKVRMRSPSIFFSVALMLAGSAILLSGYGDTPLKYGTIILVALGTYGGFPLIISWYTMNLKGHRAGAWGTGLMLELGNCGSILGTFTFVESDAPRYHKGYRCFWRVVSSYWFHARCILD